MGGTSTPQESSGAFWIVHIGLAVAMTWLLRRFSRVPLGDDAAIGIIFRGTAYALRSQFAHDEERGVRLVEGIVPWRRRAYRRTFSGRAATTFAEWATGHAAAFR